MKGLTAYISSILQARVACQTAAALPIPHLLRASCGGVFLQAR
jgi:hypothetical protein